MDSLYQKTQEMPGLRGAASLFNYQQYVSSRPAPKPKERMAVSKQDAEDIMLFWKERNFGDFNNWVQCARGVGQYDIQEIDNGSQQQQQYQGGGRRRRGNSNVQSRQPNTYQCKARVHFSDYYLPTYSAEAESKSRKDSKSACQEKIAMEIIKDGWIGLGFKEENFMEKIRQEINSKKLRVHQDKADMREAINSHDPNGGMRGMDMGLPPPPPLPGQDEKSIKNITNKISRRMQQYLLEDKFMDACQELCKIINKKPADWNEINSIWCYAVNKKNIVYLKCILDLIQQKSYIAPKKSEANKPLPKPSVAGTLPQVPVPLKPDPKKVVLEKQDQMAKDEIIRKYGKNIRMETKNPFDVYDSYNVLVNKPDLDESAKQASEQEAEKELVANPFTSDISQKLHPAISTEENKKLENKFQSFTQEIEKNKLQQQSSLQQSTYPVQKNETWGEPQKRVATEETKSTIGPVNLLNPGQNFQQPQQEIQQSRPGFTSQPYQQQSQTSQYVQQIEQYLEQLEAQKQMMDQAQYSNLKYYYTALLEQQKQEQNNASTSIQEVQGKNLGEVGDDKGKGNSSIITPTYDYAEQQRQQQYIKSNLNQDMLQEKVLRNLTGNKRAFLIQSDENPVIDSYTAREVKDPNVNYLSYKLIKEMYDQLLFCGDLNFALNIAELLYTKVKLDDSEFINSQACHYWGNKINIIMVELLESIFQIFAKSKSKPTDFLMNINGKLEKHGNKQMQEVMMFNPNENIKILESKVLKRGTLDSRDMYHQIAEGEFVMLTSLSGQKLLSESEIRQKQLEEELKKINQNVVNNPRNPFQIDQEKPLGPTKQEKLQTLSQEIKDNKNGSQNSNDAGSLMTFINQIGVEEVDANQSQEQKMFYNTVSEYGNTVEYALIGYVKNIEKDYKMKIFMLPTVEQRKAIYQEGRVWKVTKLVNKTTHEKTLDALDIFCTKVKMSHTLNQILMTPPICNGEFIRKLSQSQVAQQRSLFVVNTNLNKSQQNALQCASTQCLTLIQGPPGTGKTTTAVEIVLEWCRQTKQIILACADSNVAVDILHCEFQKAGIRSVRIGPGYDDRNEIQHDPRYRQYKVQQHLGNQQQASSIRYTMMKKQIEDCQVICATNVGSMSEFIEDMDFSRVIVDEATQSTEVTCLIPVIKNCQQLVLIGDHKQLPPTVLSVFAQSKGLTVSLFERLIKQGVKPQMLVEQYRMHPSIAVFPSHQFYNNMLQNGVGEMHRPIIKGFKWPNQYVRVAIINVQGFEQIYSSSIQNNKEVEVVIEILLQMLKGGFVKISQVGIITPYDAQKRRIRNEINHQARKFPHFFGLNQASLAKLNRNSVISDVDTVDGYQGMERDVIIMSTVRSNAGGNMGFLKDPRRMNVALTRAKRGLIIVGNIETLGSEENWKDLINWGKANKILINYF